jgi:hypothetical protein
MTTDFRALCAELLAHLEQNSDVLWHYAANKAARRTDLAVDRARAALAEGDGVGPTDEELKAFYDSHDNDDYEWPWWHRMFRELLARYGTIHPRPIPVAQRPWEREGWCDEHGRFWAGWTDFPSAGTVAGWTLCRADQVDGDDTHALPAAAIPLPENTHA